MTSTTTAHVTVAGGTIPISVKRVTVNLNEQWTPYAQAELRCELPPGDWFSQLAPTTAVIPIAIDLDQWVGYISTASDLTGAFAGKTAADLTAEFAGDTAADLTALFWHRYSGASVAPTLVAPTSRMHARLWLRSASPALKGGEIVLTAASGEALLMDDQNATSAPIVFPPGDFTNGVIRWFIARHGLELNDVTGTGFDILPLDGSLSSWEPGQSAYDFINALVEKAGRYFWCDELGRFHHVASRPDPLGVKQVLSSNLIDLDMTDDRNRDYYTAAVLTYRWETGGVSHEYVDAYDSGVFPAVTYTETIDREYPGPAGDGTTPAERYTKRFLLRRREFKYILMNDLRYRPGDRIQDFTAARPDTLVRRTRAVTHAFPDDQTNVTAIGLPT